MREKEKAGKICVIHILGIGFILLNTMNELLIDVSIEYATKDIGRSMMHLILSISTYKVKSLYTNVNKI